MNALLVTPAGQTDDIVPHEEAIAYVQAHPGWTFEIVRERNDDDNQLDLNDYVLRNSFA